MSSVIPRFTEFVNLGGVNTHILKRGVWPQASQGRQLFLIIPGNPGVMQYYDRFMEQLFLASGGEVPVWGISHTGHVCAPPDVSGCPSDPSSCPSQSQADKTPSGNGNTNGDNKNEAYSLKGQIRNKLEFVHRYVPEDVRLILIGHSIGCYMILKMLDDLIPERVVRCFLLFPTIERMAATPNGLVATPVLRWLRWVAIPATHSLSYLPISTKQRLIRWHFGESKKDKNIPSCIYEATMDFFTPFCVANSLYMGNQEMQEVGNLDDGLMERHAAKICLYYGQADLWCPREYYYRMRERQLKCDIRLCNRGYPHAFVITASDEMAEIVWSWFKMGDSVTASDTIDK